MGMNLEQILKGIKPIKEKPTDRGIKFDKTKPITPYNFPLSKITNWKAFGYKKDKLTGIKRPYWIEKSLPTGQPFIPDLDEVVKVDGSEQVF